MHPSLPSDLTLPIEAVVKYSLADEEADFAEQTRLGEDTSNHIVHSLRHLAWAVGITAEER